MLTIMGLVAYTMAMRFPHKPLKRKRESAKVEAPKGRPVDLNNDSPEKAEARKRYKEKYEARQEAGLCGKCGEPREDLKKKMCNLCVKKSCDRAKKVRKERDRNLRVPRREQAQGSGPGAETCGGPAPGGGLQGDREREEADLAVHGDGTL